MPKEKIQAECSKNKFISVLNKQNNKENIDINLQQNNINMTSGEIKMDIEPQTSNDLIASNSTKYSNNTKTSVESSNQISYNTNLIFYPSSQNQINSSNNEQNIINNHNMNYINNNINFDKLISPKKIFEYSFTSSKEKVSFVGEYLDEIYHNLLCDEKELKN